MEYVPPFFLFNNHFETIYPALLRQVALPPYQRERIKTPDDDFLDLDWIKKGSEKVVIISHGLEGNTERAYIKGMAKAMLSAGFDVLTWNYRGCGEELNKQKQFYHSGATDDLEVVVSHAVNTGYTSIYLVGFSLGGNMTLKYLGEHRKKYSAIKKATVFSVPMDLGSSCDTISKPGNFLYSRRFLKSLTEKIIRKSEIRTDIDVAPLANIKTLREFDDAFTAPIHGFRDASDYYKRCSSVHFVSDITIPTLIVNAQNDPFLSKACYPIDLLTNHTSVILETPAHGGHVGFAQFGQNGLYWSEQRTLQFLKND